MKIAVQGLWHLGSVTAACCARHFQVAGLDFDTERVARLQSGKAPLFEPGLDELISDGLRRGALSFTSDPEVACAGANVLWVCYDTPVDENDVSDVDSVLADMERVLPQFREGGPLILISSQLPVGTCARLEKIYPRLQFAYSPENLRLGKALESFEKAERVVVGLRDDSVKALVQKIFAPFAAEVLFMRTESAEMVKHALNSFLALSITFINEIARLCEHTGADAREVAAGLKSEPRIGRRAYLAPGGPFAGGTLARDVVTLSKLAVQKNEKLALIPAIKESNDRHRAWNFQRLQARLGSLENKTVAVLGLTYKPGTDTLRRSASVELCRQLLKAGARVRAFDPAVKSLPPELSQVGFPNALEQVLEGADAVVLCTEWPQLRQVDWADATRGMRRFLFIDANRFLEKELKSIPGVDHVSVGSGS